MSNIAMKCKPKKGFNLFLKFLYGFKYSILPIFIGVSFSQPSLSTEITSLIDVVKGICAAKYSINCSLANTSLNDIALDSMIYSCNQIRTESCGDFLKESSVASANSPYLSCDPTPENCQKLEPATMSCVGEGAGALWGMAKDIVLTPVQIVESVISGLDSSADCYKNRRVKFLAYAQLLEARKNYLLEKELPESVRKVISSTPINAENYMRFTCSIFDRNMRNRNLMKSQKINLAFQEEESNLLRGQSSLSVDKRDERIQKLRKQRLALNQAMRDFPIEKEGLLFKIEKAYADGEFKVFKEKINKAWLCMGPKTKADVTCATLPLLAGMLHPRTAVKSIKGFKDLDLKLGLNSFKKEEPNTRSAEPRRLQAPERKISLSKKCVPANPDDPPCELKSIVFTRETNKHIASHLVDENRIKQWFESAEFPDDLTAKSWTRYTNEVLKPNGFRAKRVTTLYPSGVSPEELLDEIKRTQLMRFHKHEADSTYEFFHKSVNYRVVVCRKPPCKVGDKTITGQDEVISLHPVCGPGVKQIVKPGRLRAILEEGKTPQLEDVIHDNPC